MGLFPFATGEGFRYRLHLPLRQRAVDPVAEAALMLTDALIVASYRLGWPKTEEVAFAMTHGFEVGQEGTTDAP